jgi:glycosyltransferase involved in cell wall biosynthesis
LQVGIYDEDNEVWGISPSMKALVKLWSNQIHRFEPTHVVFNDALTMKVSAHHALRPTFKRIGIIHTAEQLPFGPFSQGIQGHCLSPKFEESLLRDLDGIWSVSKSIQEYTKIFGNLDTTFLVHSPLTYLDSKRQMPLVRNNIDKVAVGMVNPCPHKGMDILIGLAKALPHIKFVSWASWGSGDEHLEVLNAIPNIT